jgi:dienelactone hydrolase
LVLSVVLALFIVPVLIAQVTKSEGRGFRGVALEDTQFTEISFWNAAQDIDLGGMLFAPAGEGPFTAAVIIHGSGTSMRGNAWYLTLAQYLQERGVAVLLPDKRGSEKSAGDWRSAGFEDLATDTLAAIQYLKDQERVAISEIGVIGMSQGGWIAPIVASRSHDVAFLVSFVGAAVTPQEQLLYEENLNLRQMGFLPGISNLVAFMSTAYIKNVGQKEFWDAIEGFDPLPYWKQVAVETLALYGRDDTNVPSADSAEILRALNNPRITVRIYEGSGHALADPVHLGDSIIREDALEDIWEFIRAVAEHP